MVNVFVSSLRTRQIKINSLSIRFHIIISSNRKTTTEGDSSSLPSCVPNNIMIDISSLSFERIQICNEKRSIYCITNNCENNSDSQTRKTDTNDGVDVNQINVPLVKNSIS